MTGGYPVQELCRHCSFEEVVKDAKSERDEHAGDKPKRTTIVDSA